MPLALTLALATAFVAFNSASAAKTDPAVRKALEDFYIATTGPATWNARDNWIASEDYCTWFGVSCDAEGNVIKISLRGNGLSTAIPEAIFRIPTLQHVDLGENLLAGTIPNRVCELKGLRYLLLDRNYLEGAVPECLCGAAGGTGNGDSDSGAAAGAASSLLYLNVANNWLTSVPKCLRGLPKIREIRASCNRLQGVVRGQEDKGLEGEALEYYDVACNPFSTDDILNTCIWCGPDENGEYDMPKTIYRVSSDADEACEEICMPAPECPAVFDQGACGELVLEEEESVA